METLRKGSKGESVRTLQEFLKITVDGDFGPKTESAVKSYQKKNRTDCRWGGRKKHLDGYGYFKYR